ncbi:MAG TPA: mycothiol maleylpyruvate isomerase [Nocardioides bacterium]|uniref:maleylpyruvate isomerase N-terminal domain-containing protein n=1 Tax=uncultured Nocardioides sp. TaxID=198441 RepID=UPI000ED487DB|nr:maleylpyruvate isomerase N-terminal domain-containing protein [uncultured Nocardioides sp.]HCB04646.1 mycothiol maleylpyruvate isomerase [Nocardioides sp.]
MSVVDPSPVEGAYLEVAGSFVDLVASLPASLTGPGLGEWDLRALVGHTARSLITVIEYLDRPADAATLDSPAAYVAAAGELVAADPGAVTQRGVAAGDALGAEPAAYVRDLLGAVSAKLADADPDQLVTTIAGGMRLRDYLPTRSFELVVHGLDIAAAVPTHWTPPAAALRTAVAVAGEVAVLRGEGSALLRLITGREPGGISIV